ncbi:MAG: ribonuclease P protein component [Candidatus Binatia bacterium]
MSQDRESFRKRARLSRRSEFLGLSRGGRKVYTPHFIVISKANDRRVHRLGITVSAKVGKAVVRNRVKRLLREFFRRQQNSLSAHRDFLVIARKGAGDLSQREVAGELGKAFPARGNIRRCG